MWAFLGWPGSKEPHAGWKWMSWMRRGEVRRIAGEADRGHAMGAAEGARRPLPVRTRPAALLG
jgi:hypothetical protein